MALAIAFFLAVAIIIGTLVYAQQSMTQKGLIILGSSLGVIFLAAIAAILLYVQLQSRPSSVVDYADATLLQSEQDALFALGQPNATAESDQGTVYRFDRKWYRQYVTIGPDGVSRSYVERTGNYFPAPRMFGVNGDQGFDQVVEILGEPSSTIVDGDGVGRILIFDEFNIFIVYSTRTRMEAIGIFDGDPVQFSELSLLRP